MSGKSVALISRLPVHGASLHKLLSRYYDVFWIGRTFPFKITFFNVFYVLSLELCKLLVTFRRSRFSLIVLQFVSLDGIAAVLFSRIFKTKLVLFAVGSDVLKGLEHAVAYPLIKFIIERSDFVFSTSGLIEGKLEAIGVDASKIGVIPSVIDLDDFEPYYGPQMYDIVNVGALDSNKNQMLLIKACELFPSVTVLIIGDGPLREVLETESIKKNLRIVFLGRIPHKQVFRELQKSRIYVQTSKSEGLPVAVLEAMFLGLPIILVESQYVYDIKHRYGFKFHIVKEGSIDDLAHKISEVLENYDLESCIAALNKLEMANLVAKSSMEIKEKLDKLCCGM